MFAVAAFSFLLEWQFCIVLQTRACAVLFQRGPKGPLLVACSSFVNALLCCFYLLWSLFPLLLTFAEVAIYRISSSIALTAAVSNIRDILPFTHSVPWLPNSNWNKLSAILEPPLPSEHWKCFDSHRNHACSRTGGENSLSLQIRQLHCVGLRN